MFGWKMQENSIDSTDFTDIFLIFTKKKKMFNWKQNTSHTFIYLFIHLRMRHLRVAWYKKVTIVMTVMRQRCFLVQ